MSHLSIKAKGRTRTLREDQSIDIEFQNPMWGDTEIFSYPIDLPFEGNRDMLKNVDDTNSDIRPITLEHEPMQIIADGVPIASGPMVIAEDEALTDGLSINIDAAVEDFNSMIGDLQCNEVPIPESDYDSLVIGEKISNVNVEIGYTFNIRVSKGSGKHESNRTVPFPGRHDKVSFEPQALGFSYPAKCVVTGDKQEAAKDTDMGYRDGFSVIKPQIAESYINVTDEYLGNKRASSKGAAKYCNARVCYKHYDKGEDGQTSDSVVMVDDGKGGKEDHGPLWVLEADRPQSGICFYILYFLECLFKHIGVNYDIDALLNIEDLKHLCFYTTKCSYRTEILHCKSRYTADDAEVKNGLKNVGDVKEPFFSKEVGESGKYLHNVTEAERKSLFDDINKWLSSRGCGGQLELEELTDVDINEIYLEPASIHNFGFEGNVRVGKEVDEIKVLPTLHYAKVSANISKMMADNGNFPDMSVSSLISSLENMFGIKFSYDYEQRKVTAYLMRDVLTQNAVPRTFHAKDLTMVPVTEKITGVRVGYSEEADAKEQRNNVRDAVKKFNTSYDYIDFPDPAKADEHKTTILDKTYADIFRKPNHGDENVYIDLRTGNAYRIKIDENFTDVNDMDPKLFEVAQFHCVEEGDCSERNKDFVREYMSDFSPIDFVDANYRREKEYVDTKGELVSVDGDIIYTINESSNQPLLAAFMDEDMEHEFIEQRIRQNVAGQYVNAYLTEVLKCQESYNPSDTEDGNSPLQHYKWGNAIAMMRGGGANSTVEQYDSNYDGFGNNKWMMRAGLYALTSDSIDQWKEMYDYNGVSEGGFGEHFSLKPRAYKQPSWAPEPLCDEDFYEGNERIRVRSRGYVDTFLKEFIYFLLHRKKYRIECLCSVAQVADIPNHWHEWWVINGKKCLISKVNTSIHVTTGIGKVELEVYSL